MIYPKHQEDMLMVADPKALQYVTVTSGYRFPKPQDVRQITAFLMGRGILNVEGVDHNRHRKVLNLAFSPKQLRQFLGLFQRLTGRARLLVMKWQQELSNYPSEGSVINTQLDFLRLSVDSRLYPRKRQLLYRAFLTKEEKRFLAFLNASKRVARPFFQKASEGRMADDDIQGSQSKDVLSVLIRANREEDPRKALDKDEVLSQMAENEPTPQDLDSMSFFNAVIKEGLRLYPIVQNVTREAQSDDVIPLEFPVTTVSGDEISQVPSKRMSKGNAMSGLCTTNFSQVWGHDAEQWNPERFINPTKKNTTLGVYANLFDVFQCWFTSLYRMVVRLEFRAPASGELDDIQAVSFGVSLPKKKGKWYCR
ncbi:cytochrome P450 [Lentinula aciculospora]|uniref:Cytochrome P450 n=1 Tax=Lentinula aciculospora TaxID=153920 RepID=A0A9W9A909_9AGAR|nr:cytochrome P450 [Lentinula aciculospora]